jgi:hypothetical protein
MFKIQRSQFLPCRARNPRIQKASRSLVSPTDAREANWLDVLKADNRAIFATTEE